jgi:hypothetical protein
MEQIPPWEAKNRSDAHENLHNLLNPKVNYCVHYSLTVMENNVGI